MEGSSDEAEYLSCCNVCFIKFDLDQFRPKVLPCSHTFCFRCLQAIHTESTLNCPVCRQGVELDQVAALPNNVYAQHIIQLNQQLKGTVRKELSMHWCFACNSVTKPACSKKKHVVIDMSRIAKELQFKMKRSKANLGTALEKRRQLKQSLEISLALHKAQTEEIQKQMTDNSQELNQLEYMLETEPDFNTSHREIAKRFKETNNVLGTSSELVDEWQARLEALKWMHVNSGYSWRQRAYLLRSSSVGKNYLQIRETKRSCLEAIPDRVKDKVTCFAFHPVKPILACGFKSGTIGFFVGKKHSSPFSSWTHIVWRLEGYSITSIEFNALGNELAIGDKKSGVVIWNTVTNDITDLGYVFRNCRIKIIRWNRKWAPDLLAVSCENDVLVWDLSKPDTEPAYEFEAIHSRSVEYMVWMSADKLATCSCGQIKISQLGNPHPIHIMESMDKELLEGLWWNGDMGQLATCCFDSGRVIVWTFDEEQNNGNLSSSEDSSDDSSENEDTVVKTKIMCEYYGVICLDWYPLFIGPDSDEYDQNEGVLACGTRENLVTILNPTIKRTLNRLVGHTGEVCSVAYSPDGKYLASLSAGKELIIWSPEDNYRKLTFYDLSASSERNITWSTCCKMLTLFGPGITKSEEIRVFEIIERKS